MINKVDKAFNFHHTALNIRSARQELLSSNVANADTPNFKAKDIDFSSVLSNALSSDSKQTKLVTTSSKHMQLGSDSILGSQVLYRVPLQPSADGNTVDMDSERTRFSNNSIKYDASLTFMSGQIRGLLSAIQE